MQHFLAGLSDLTKARITQLSATRWSNEEAAIWFQLLPWQCGFNFLPSSAVNFVEMWAQDSFDQQTIDRELGWGQSIGFNTVRVNLPFILWQHERDHLLANIDRFLTITHSHQIKTVFCLFDDCGFSGNSPSIGRQPDPVPGLHNSRALASPGHLVLLDLTMRHALKAYVDDIMSNFGSDPRVLFWDLCNEPGNTLIFEATGNRYFEGDLENASMALMLDVFEWARHHDSIHPLTVGGWRIPWDTSDNRFYEHPLDDAAFCLSDIISFHGYCDAKRMEAVIDFLQAHNRPLMCTEWMARTAGSRIADQLPLFKSRNVGCWQWGLVKGRTQTHIPWPDVKMSIHDYDEQITEWFHDLLDIDGMPHNPAEIELIGELTGRTQNAVAA